MVKVTHQCCFCGDNIDSDSQLDPCGIVIYTNIDKGECEQREQMFFCHYECFRDVMDSGTRIHLVLDQVAE